MGKLPCFSFFLVKYIGLNVLLCMYNNDNNNNNIDLCTIKMYDEYVQGI